MQLSDFDYSLPERLIAQHPFSARDESRLMVVDRQKGLISHDIFRHLDRYLAPDSPVSYTHLTLPTKRIV